MEDKNKIQSGWSNDFFPQLQEYEGKLSVSHMLLGIIGIAGILTIAVLAPNAMRILRIIEPRRWEKNNPKYRINETLQRLKREGLITVEKIHEGEPCVRLTQKGEQRFCRVRFRMANNTRKVWDGKWRIVMFDIMEKHRKVRTYFRAELTNMGFRKLQNSVWVYPYECEDVLALLKIDLKLGHDVLYFVSEKMEGDAYLRRLFSLPVK